MERCRYREALANAVEFEREAKEMYGNRES